MSKIVLGISGYIGSGKSEAGDILKGLGAYLIDADEVVDGLYKIDAPGYRKIRNFFGESFIGRDGRIDRKKLARFVFSDVNKLKILNGLIHPLVAAEIKQAIRNAQADIVAVEAVYIMNGGLAGLIDKTIWVDCKRDILTSRLLKKGKYGPGMIDKIYEMQEKMGIRPLKPAYLVDNSGGKGALRQQLKKVWNELSQG